MLLLDEPASGLDPRARVEIKALIEELRRWARRSSSRSHILPELADFCNKIGIIERGRLLVAGDVEGIVRKLQPARRLTIRTVGELNGLRAAIERIPKVVNVTGEGNTAQVEFQGDLEEQAQMLASLVESGHRVCSFTETGMDLEDVFMQVTTGKVQ